LAELGHAVFEQHYSWQKLSKPLRFLGLARMGREICADTFLTENEKMDIRQIIEAAGQDPNMQQALQVAQAELSDASPEQIAELIQLLEFAIQNPERYPEIRQAAIADDMVDPEDLPEQFDPNMIAAVLAVLYKLQSGGGAPMAMARGGLANMRTMARRGRYGDTMLAHINPEEAAMLRARGGAGTINPETGLPQYFSLKKLFKAVLPIAAMFIAPYLAPYLGGSMLAAGAVAGGLGAGLTGGNVLQGAVLGGLGQGLGGMVGGAVAPGVTAGTQSLIGSGLIGGAMGAATGQGFVKGALQGAGGAYLGGQFGGLGGEGFKSAGQTFGNMMTAGYDPKSAVIAGGLSGLAASMSQPQASGRAPVAPRGYGAEDLGTGLSMSPSDTVIEGLRVGGGDAGRLTNLGTTNYMTGETGMVPGQAPTVFGAQPQMATGVTPPVDSMIANVGTSTSPLTAAAKPGIFGTGVSPMQAMALASVAGSLGGAPEPVQQAVRQLSPEQQEYFNRPSLAFDWNKMQRDAAASNVSLSEYMAQSWPQITAGTYNQPVQRQAYARGGHAQSGPLSQVARMARGAGSGRDDTIDAKLSDGEYVMDAETVAMVGDGSTDEGARRLDKMRAELRRHKGKALAKGKFSPNAKSPLSYLKGAA